MNSSFIDEPDLNESVWRYLSIEKFNHLLSSSKLFLSVASSLGDKYEGTLPAGYGADTPKGKWMRSMLKKSTFISCWHNKPHESIAMWNMYCKSKGVAIRTTYKKLSECFPDGYSYIVQANYVDYHADQNQFDDKSFIQLFAHKKHEYEYESEVRIIKPVIEYLNFIADRQEQDYRLASYGDHYGVVSYDSQALIPMFDNPQPEWGWEFVRNRDGDVIGLTFPVDLHEFIDEIVFFPPNNELFKNLVKDTIARHQPSLMSKLRVSVCD